MLLIAVIKLHYRYTLRKNGFYFQKNVYPTAIQKKYTEQEKVKWTESETAGKHFSYNSSFGHAAPFVATKSFTRIFYTVVYWELGHIYYCDVPLKKSERKTNNSISCTCL